MGTPKTLETVAESWSVEFNVMVVLWGGARKGPLSPVAGIISIAEGTFDVVAVEPEEVDLLVEGFEFDELHADRKMHAIATRYRSFWCIGRDRDR
jgi:hypothetical protein